MEQYQSAPTLWTFEYSGECEYTNIVDIEIIDWRHGMIKNKLKIRVGSGLVIMILLLNFFVLVPISLTGSVKALRFSMDTSLSNADASFIGENADDGSGYSVAGAGEGAGKTYRD